MEQLSVIDLIKRIEKIEKSLSSRIDKAISKKSLHENMSGKHAEEEKLDPQNDDLETDKAIPVVISSKAYLKMALHSKKYANDIIPKNDWVEVIGLLTGHIKNENTPLEQIEIDDAWPVGHGDAVSVEIIETKSVTDIIEKTPQNRYIVGWYHSHPSYGNFLSIDDWNTQSRYQTLWNKSIAVVIDPTKISKSDQGFSVFRNTNKVEVKKGYTELSSVVDGFSPESSFEILNMVRPAYQGEKLTFLEYGNNTLNG